MTRPPDRTFRGLTAALVALCALAVPACSGAEAVSPPAGGTPPQASASSLSPTPARVTATPRSPSPTAAPSPTVPGTPASDAARFTPQRPRTATDEPFTVNGIPVVSKAYPLTRAYVPRWADEPHGLHPDALDAFNRLAAAARAEGLTLTIRSGYRSYATQAASFARALGTYDEATARRYFAEAGRSEHQTGLAFDVWDGVNRGSAFARTEEAGWLARNAHRFGLIVRYPQGRTEVTGYAWESWHLRWVGRDVASAFGPNSTLTLEEYLGLA